jgi:hypothetical protein
MSYTPESIWATPVGYLRYGVQIKDWGAAALIDNCHASDLKTLWIKKDNPHDLLFL